MANQLTAELLAELYGQESSDPFLMLVELSHVDFITTQRLVNNTVDILSRGNTYIAFPMSIRLAVDDGESSREIQIEFDNVGRELIDEIRSITTPMNVKIEMVLASNPDQVQIALEDLSIRSISYNKSKISARLFLDDFLNTAMTEERYSPTLYPGLF